MFSTQIEVVQVFEKDINNDLIKKRYLAMEYEKVSNEIRD